MPLSNSLTAEQHAALAENLKGAYRIKGDGSYELDLSAGSYVIDQDPAALLNSNNHIKTENNNLKARVSQLEQDERNRQNALLQGDLIEKKDFEGLKDNYQKQIDEQNQRHQEEIKRRDDARALDVNKQKAFEIAAQINPEAAHLLAPMIENRLKTSIVDGIPKIEVLDANGNITAGTIETLKQNILDDPRNKPYIVETKASGGSSPDGSHQNPDSVVPVNGSGEKYEDFDTGSLTILKKSDRSRFDKLLSDFQERTGNKALGSA